MRIDLLKVVQMRLKDNAEACGIEIKGMNKKATAKDLEKLPRSGITIEATRIKGKVADTRYTVIYKVINNPTQKLIAKRIIRHK